MNDRGWTQDDLALRAGVRQQHVSQMVNGLRTPGLRTMTRLAEALRVTLNYLAGLPEPAPAVLSPGEDELLTRYRALNDAQRAAILAVVKSLETAAGAATPAPPPQ